MGAKNKGIKKVSRLSIAEQDDLFREERDAFDERWKRMMQNSPDYCGPHKPYYGPLRDPGCA